jgi:hypothetical protein
MTEQDQGESAAESPPQTIREQQVAETRKAAQGDVPPFFGSGTLEEPMGNAAPAVAPTASQTQTAAPAETSDSTGDGS